ncbi:MAG: hypothetical protein RMJ88_03340 [Thermogemmata sp.]|nr:hypothetical protein [Thermogemmata sp.]
MSETPTALQDSSPDAEQVANIRARMLDMLVVQLRQATEKTKKLMDLWQQNQPVVNDSDLEAVVHAGQLLREVIIKEGGLLPEEIRQEAIELVQWLEKAIRHGDAWLQNVGGPQLAETIWRDRLGKAYGHGLSIG